MSLIEMQQGMAEGRNGGEPALMAEEILRLLTPYDKAGIASRGRLEDAPADYHPSRIMPDFQSVIVLARETSKHEHAAKVHHAVATIAAQDAVIRYLRGKGYKTEVIGSRAKAVSLPRLGERAGVGELSPFHSLAVRGHGLRTVLTAIITDAPLESSPMATDACPDRSQCLKRCAALNPDGQFDRSRCKSCGACVATCPVES